MTVAGVAIGIFTRTTCAGRMGRAGFDAVVGSDFLGMRTGLALTTSRSGF